MKRALMTTAALLAGLAALAGCRSGGGASKTVASVNGSNITQDEFYERLQRVDTYNLGQNPMHAGEYAMAALIDERITEQMAKSKSAVPTDAEVTAYIALCKKYPRFSNLTLLPPDPLRDDSDMRRDVRNVLLVRNLLVKQTPPQDADVKTAYDRYKSQFVTPARYHLRLINCGTKAKGEQILDSLSKNVPFETAALKESVDKQTAARNGDVGWIDETQLQTGAPQLLAAVKPLKPLEYTKKVIEMQARTPASASQPARPVGPVQYVLAQVVEVQPAQTPTLDEVRPLVENVVVQQKDPMSMQRLADTMRQSRQDAKIDISIPWLKPLVDKIKHPAAQPVAPMPAPGPAGAAPGGPAAAPGTSAPR